MISMSERAEGRTPAVLLVILAASCLLYVAAFTPARFGFYHDDGIYVVTAKALATGQGYRIISLPYEPSQTKYPPFYPFLLSLVWRAYPHFPENLWLLTSLSMGATVTFLALAFRYLVREGYASRGTALLVVALAAINGRTVILATSMYSEMIYAALSVGGLWLAERYLKGRLTWFGGTRFSAGPRSLRAPGLPTRSATTTSRGSGAGTRTTAMTWQPRVFRPRSS